jgi:hypothetical protein
MPTILKVFAKGRRIHQLRVSAASNLPLSLTSQEKIFGACRSPFMHDWLAFCSTSLKLICGKRKRRPPKRAPFHNERNIFCA